jgi:hypothetical protein
MNIYKDFIKSTKAHESLLAVLLIIYIIFDIQTPVNMLNLANNGIFQSILVILVISLFFYVNPIISILAIIALFLFFDRSKNAIKNFNPSENNKFNDMVNYNKSLSSNYNLDNQNTLEEQMVEKMAPPIIDNDKIYSFQPITDKQHNAKNLNDHDEFS